ncbi:MAG: ABC transporter substrate-binding protein [Bacteroidetes bacterium]|nr:ABC transporter substrate-binding protein [Bacteroidota bacterium]
MERKQCSDQLGRPIEFNFPPQRIVSLVPSQTELLFDLGVGDRVVGITKFCVHPEEWLKSKKKVGGTKNFNLEVIGQLNPDIIIGNKEENDEERIKLLFEKHPVWMSDITDWKSAIQMIEQVGSLVDETSKATVLINEIESRFRNVIRFQPKKTLYFIWKNPWMAAGKNTFIDTMLLKIGLVNCVPQERYPILSDEEIKKLSPELVLLSSEPYPFKEKHIQELQQILPDARILLVDGEMFSWYCSRLLKAPDYFSSLSL